MPFVFDQPNLDRAAEKPPSISDPCDGRLITILPMRTQAGRHAHVYRLWGAVHHIAFYVCGSRFCRRVRIVSTAAPGFKDSGVKDRGLQWISIYFQPIRSALTIEAWRTYRFEAACRVTPHTDVAVRGPQDPRRGGDYNIKEELLADAIELSGSSGIAVRRFPSDRSPKNPY